MRGVVERALLRAGRAELHAVGVAAEHGVQAHLDVCLGQAAPGQLLRTQGLTLLRRPRVACLAGSARRRPGPRTIRMREGAQRACRHLERAKVSANCASLSMPCAGRRGAQRTAAPARARQACGCGNTTVV